MWLVWCSLALAGGEQTFTWDLLVNGAKVGQQTTTVRSHGGGDHIFQTTASASFSVGAATTSYRQRLTGHSAGSQPASFTSVVEQDGLNLEVQARWAAEGWKVSINSDGAARTSTYPHSRLDLSMVDISNPNNHLRLSRYARLGLLLPETGEVLTGTVKSLGSSVVRVGAVDVAVSGVEFLNGQGPLNYFFDPDGVLVKFESRIAGTKVTGVLSKPPPAGSDDFPVSVGLPTVEVIDL